MDVRTIFQASHATAIGAIQVKRSRFLSLLVISQMVGPTARRNDRAVKNPTRGSRPAALIAHANLNWGSGGPNGTDLYGCGESVDGAPILLSDLGSPLRRSN